MTVPSLTSSDSSKMVDTFDTFESKDSGIPLSISSGSVASFTSSSVSPSASGVANPAGTHSLSTIGKSGVSSPVLLQSPTITEGLYLNTLQEHRKNLQLTKTIIQGFINQAEAAPNSGPAARELSKMTIDGIIKSQELTLQAFTRESQKAVKAYNKQIKLEQDVEGNPLKGVDTTLLGLHKSIVAELDGLKEDIKKIQNEYLALRINHGINVSSPMNFSLAPPNIEPGSPT